MDIFTLVVVFIIGCIFYFLIRKKREEGLKVVQPESLIDAKVEGNEIPASVLHKKIVFLATENEKKLYYALQKVLSEKYIVHCQVPLISIVEPVDPKNNRRSWAKRVDFVVTNKATKILAIIELDDSSHNSKKAQKRDFYVNEALKGNHPLIRINTEKFYDPKNIAKKLYKEAGIGSAHF